MFNLNKILQNFEKNKPVIVFDSPNRENEADLILPVQKCTSEAVNFAISQAKGLLCVAVEKTRQLELELNWMQANAKNNSLYHTNFTVSVDLLGHGVTTGISASDRAKTIQALADSNFQAADFARPGHIFPLVADPLGLKSRAGHTETAVTLAKLGNYFPVAFLIEILALPQKLEVKLPLYKVK